MLEDVEIVLKLSKFSKKIGKINKASIIIFYMNLMEV